MDLKEFEKIKKIAIISMFSDDILMDKLVLKGGNALDIIYNIAERSSMDLDFSIDHDFDEEQLKDIVQRIEKSLDLNFKEAGYRAFDIVFSKRPKKDKKKLDFWGGYRIEFKVIKNTEYEKVQNIEILRKMAETLGKKQTKNFLIEISKHEHCKQKEEHELNGYTIYVYTPAMIIFEKLRAICQQMPEYNEVVKSKKTARARDFFDIYTVFKKFKIDLDHPDNIELLRSIFQAKHVPIELIEKIPEYKEYHRPDFQAVKDTVKPNMPIREFDYYFDFVVAKFLN